jgi:catechol 2,3-dioxygenase-like lactoylglutathione lyase family enzyme
MLEESQVLTPIAVTDLDRAATFYKETLGLEPASGDHDDNIVILQTKQGQKIGLHVTETAGSEHTLAVFMVKDLAAAMAELRAKGIIFFNYDTPDLKTVDGIATTPTFRCAWFGDPDGNILSITELTRSHA